MFATCYEPIAFPTPRRTYSICPSTNLCFDFSVDAIKVCVCVPMYMYIYTGIYIYIYIYGRERERGERERERIHRQTDGRTDRQTDSGRTHIEREREREREIYMYIYRKIDRYADVLAVTCRTQYDIRSYTPRNDCEG